MATDTIRIDPAGIYDDALLYAALRIVKRTKLANFAARIVGQTIQDDGAEQQRQLEVLVEQFGRTSVTMAVPIERFTSLDFIVEGAGPRCVIQPGSGKRDHLRCAVQELSDPDIPTSVVYRHTGFRDINGCWCYLHGNGAIGPDGVVPGVQVRLDGNAALYRLPPPPDHSELVECLRASLGILNGLAADEIVYPLLSSTYRAPLKTPDYSPWFSGLTGEGKSELLALAQQHYGAEMTRLRLPGNWSSTDNALEGIAFTIKDALFTVDDFCPAGAEHDHERMHRVADRLMRAQGNHSARQRMRADGTLRPPKPPRGLVAGTGEDVPRGHSLAARLAIVEVARGSVNFARLSECQRAAAAGAYAAAMAGYVRWLARDYAAVQAGVDRERIELRDQFLNKYPHNRTPEVIANLLIGLRYVLRFAEAVGAIDQQEREAHWGRGLKAFQRIGERQAEHQRAADPVARFGDMVCTVISSGRGHIAGHDGQVPEVPPSPEFWGWEGRQFRSGTDETTTNYSGRGHKIGWVVGEDLYLDPDATYASVVELAQDQGVPFPLTQQTLYRRLKENRLLVRCEKDRPTYPVVLEGSRRRVLNFSATALLQKPGQPGQSPDPAAHAVPVSCPGFPDASKKPGQENSANFPEKPRSVPVIPVIPVSSTEGGGRIDPVVVEPSESGPGAAGASSDDESKKFHPSSSQKPGKPGKPGQAPENTEKKAAFSCTGFRDGSGKPVQETGTEGCRERLPASEAVTDPSAQGEDGHPQPPSPQGADGPSGNGKSPSRRRRGTL